MAEQAEKEMQNLSLEQDEGGADSEVKVNEEGIPYVKLNGAYHPPLADGKYDAIVLSTGESCRSRSTSSRLRTHVIVNCTFKLKLKQMNRSGRVCPGGSTRCAT